MTRQFCDRCNADITLVADADSQGNGTITRTADLYTTCRHGFEAWLTPSGVVRVEPTKKRKDRR